jgi:hypothetical protein
MKFDEVIINENKLGDWMFGDKRTRGQGGMGGTGGPRVKAPSIGVGGGTTKLDRLAYKFFVRDFVSDALSTIDSGLKSGLINPPVGPGSVTGDDPEGQTDGQTDVNNKQRLMPGFQEKMRRMFNPKMKGHEKYGEYKRDTSDFGKETDGFNKPKVPTKRKMKWQQYSIKDLIDKGLTTQEIKRAYPGWNGNLTEWIKYVELNTILESVIDEQADQTDVETTGGRMLSVFMKDWFGQWMQGVDYSKSKDVLYKIIDALEQTYDASKNPSKPTIDRNILVQLADGAWAATSTVGVAPIGTKNAQGAEVIQKSIQAQGAKEPELKSKETPMKPVQIPAGIAIKDAGGTEYFYNGEQWIDSSGKALSAEDQQKYSKMYAMDPKTFYKTELTPPKKSVKESKTQSAIRAEKIPSLKTR